MKQKPAEYFVGYVVTRAVRTGETVSSVAAVDYAGGDSYKVTLTNGNAYTVPRRFIRRDHQ